jgi:hypothetical protein
MKTSQVPIWKRPAKEVVAHLRKESERLVKWWAWKRKREWPL